MANKLYEEAAVSDIAAAIRQAHGGTDTYTVGEMGDAIRANRRVYEGELTETIVGGSTYLALAKEDVLAEHRSDDTLFVRVAFDVEAQAYTVIRAAACNSLSFPWWETVDLQKSRRWTTATSETIQQSAVRIDSDSPLGVACINITSDGELRIYSNSNNFALRPSKWKAIVEWGSII